MHNVYKLVPSVSWENSTAATRCQRRLHPIAAHNKGKTIEMKVKKSVASFLPNTESIR